ncbi:MAG: Na/Pi symporter [Planctomycetota bacterium]|jgi:sodium-dependent phosphate cotransporter|nr:Na/Pi symporter [Planctomycetota bacterium]MDP6939878.1 Na/Pi symporter [Planctomycetota bacterium]
MSSGSSTPQLSRIAVASRLGYVIFLVYGFLISIRLMGSAIKALGSDTAQELFSGVSNPFAGLAVGTLATVLVQSSSTSTATIVSLVGQSGGTALPLKTAVPMVMGANIGTTITNTIVSVGHLKQGNAFRRAFAAATVHDFFNLMLVMVVLPLELATGILEKTAIKLTGLISNVGGAEYDSPIKAAVKAGAKPIEGFLKGLGLEDIPLAIVLVAFALALIVVCLVQITKNMRSLISGSLERALNRVLGRSGLLGIGIGIVMTVSVQSSSITTSLLVPMCAAGVLTLRNAFPIMLGANIGTTVTALLASLATDSEEGLTIALVHALFNVGGVMIVYPIPALRGIPIRLARLLSVRAQRNIFWVVGYVGVVFILLPLLGYLVFGALE